ncbi:hypothetical protein CWE13_09450 [Aliidiomarina shirensis]|uniref:Histidine kinase/HSP90-like ATPase domain-containing protein n=1 Tax=Aliidiomarina shirensis TaxID=1048642 RepID=A0A432WQK7_9GAMM|nr:sensor histidine kinase [Aliidiomarina shirensis]RUO36092.1 hypothetical protein CWE13_09450 [Aliidiomarina shirensis]
MKLKKLPLDADQLSGIGTILLVAAFDLWLLTSTTDASSQRLVTLAFLYAAFTLLFFFNTYDNNAFPRWAKLAAIGGQFTLICAVMYTTPHMFSAILLVVWSAQIPYFIPFRYALWISPLWSILPWCIFFLRWQSSGVLITGALFYTFNIFALVMMEARRNAEVQKERAEQANRELVAMQSLVQEASLQNERMRIARDIHDVVGHHLTALSVQLQVLAHEIPEKHKPDVERSRAISKLLLADVRAAVSEMREHEQLNLRQALEALVGNLPNIDVNLAVPDRVDVLKLEHALAILRGVQECITNSLKHGKATRIDIAIKQEANELVVCVRDNGKGDQPIQFGNGLKGMQERLENIKGSLSVQREAKGVTVCLKVPVSV